MLFFYFFIWFVFYLIKNGNKINQSCKKSFKKDPWKFGRHCTVLKTKFETEKKVYLEPCQTSKMDFFAKIDNGWKPLTIFAKKLHLRYFTGFLIRHCMYCFNRKLKNYLIWKKEITILLSLSPKIFNCLYGYPL